MKYIIGIVLVGLFSTASYGQSDSLTLSEMKQGIEHMKMNLERSHWKFKDGLGITLVGAGVIGAGLLMEYDYTEAGTKKFAVKDVTLILGSALTILGTAVMIDSHKYIGRAGRWQYTGNGITYSLH